MGLSAPTDRALAGDAEAIRPSAKVPKREQAIAGNDTDASGMDSVLLGRQTGESTSKVGGPVLRRNDPHQPQFG
jgi:hypothetical protein